MKEFFSKLYSNDNLTEEQKQAVKNVAVAMLNYGTACQAQFYEDFYTSPNEELDPDDKNTALLSTDEFHELTEVALPKKSVINDDPALADLGVSFAGYTLFVQSNTTLRFYFKVNDTGKYDAAQLKLGDSTAEFYTDNPDYVYAE